MTKLALALATTSFAVGLLAISSAGQAQNSDNISEIVVYGNDPCPRSTDDEVVVCARKPEAERYRIPEKYRESGPAQTRRAWANKARSFETVGATGINSCSPVGPAGYTGCLTQVIRQAQQEAADSQDRATAPEQ